MNQTTNALVTTASQQEAAVTNDYGWDDTPWTEWKYLTGEQIDAFDRDTTVVLVSCSPLEVHGPHLPTYTDYAEADGIMFRTAQLLKKKHSELTFLHLPPLWVAADVLPHVGSVTFDPKTLTQVLVDMGRSLCKQGFKNIWVGSFHGGPRHFVSIEVAAAKVNRKYGGRMLSMFGMLMNQMTGGSTDLSGLLAEHTDMESEQLVGDTHGGTIETSLMLHLNGQHVNPVYDELDRNTVDIELARVGEDGLGQEHGNPSFWDTMRGLKWKLRFFEDYTYAGDPALSDADFGEQTLDALAEISVAPLSQVYERTLPQKQWHSPLWKVRWLFTWRWMYWVFDKVFGRRDNLSW